MEESVNAYKQDIFWENLTTSISSSTWLNDPSQLLQTEFSIQSEELEQILNSSHKVDAVDHNTSLVPLLAQCYSIRDKIKTHFSESFGRHYIFTSSETNEYCLLLINDGLIKNFRRTNLSAAATGSNFSSQMQNSQSNESLNIKQLNSFALLKFNNSNKSVKLMQINRRQEQEQRISQQCSLLKRANETKSSENLNTSSDVASSIKSDDSIVEENLHLNAHLSFVVNNLMFVLWEGLFFSN